MTDAVYRLELHSTSVDATRNSSPDSAVVAAAASRICDALVSIVKYTVTHTDVRQ